MHQLLSQAMSINVLHSSLSSVKRLVERIDEYEDTMKELMKRVPSVVYKYVPDNLVITASGTIRYLKEDVSGEDDDESGATTKKSSAKK